MHARLAPTAHARISGYPWGAPAFKFVMSRGHWRPPEGGGSRAAAMPSRAARAAVHDASSHAEAAAQPASPTPWTFFPSNAALDDLALRLSLARLPPDSLPTHAALDPNGAWVGGVPRAEAEALLGHWRDVFLPDFRSVHLPRLNALPQFTLGVHVPASFSGGTGVEVAGGSRSDAGDGDNDGAAFRLNLHFVHAVSDASGAVPLLLVHGWPGSFVEFLELIPLLVSGDERGRAFHVVAPSLPGFAFSEAPKQPGADTAFMARALDALMVRLGYGDGYVAQGGDWGALITQALATQCPHRCVALHVNMGVTRQPRDAAGKLLMLASLPFLGADDRRRLRDTLHFLHYETAYQVIQGTKPNTLGAALNDSPVGLMCWVLEKAHTWSDRRGDAGGPRSDGRDVDAAATGNSDARIKPTRARTRSAARQGASDAVGGRAASAANRGGGGGGGCQAAPATGAQGADTDPWELGVPRDALLLNITLYWLSQCASSSLRIYYEALDRHPHATSWISQDSLLAEGDYCPVPTAVLVASKEIIQPPRSWAALTFNLVHWTTPRRGGHFFAMEQPEALAEDVRRFFHDVVSFDECKRRRVNAGARRPFELAQRAVLWAVFAIFLGWLLTPAALALHVESAKAALTEALGLVM